MNYYSKLFCWTIFTIQKAPYNQILPQSNEIQGLLLAAHIKRKVLLQLEGEPAIQTNKFMELPLSFPRLFWKR